MADAHRFHRSKQGMPQGHHPLSRIDQLVDSTSGYEMLSMMDAFQGDHQIPLAIEDRKKVSFVTSKGTYCYVAIPFELKNAGAIYRQMVDQMFRDQIGRNMEIYVDNMSVTSKKAGTHISDLEETFRTLRRLVSN